MASLRSTNLRRRGIAAVAAIATFAALILPSSGLASAAENPVACQPPEGGETTLSLGFVRDAKGRFTTIQPPTGGKCLHKVSANGVNNRGQVVGGYRENGYLIGEGSVRNFLWRKGRLKILDLSALDRPGIEVTANDINDRRQIVGSYIDVAKGAIHGFLRERNGEITTIDHPQSDGTAVLGATGTLVTRITNRGEVVGYYAAGGTIHGFLRDRKGRFTTIDRPGAAATAITGINERGQIVGASSDIGPVELLGGGATGFLLDQGAYTDLAVPGTSNGAPNEIAKRRQIAGNYLDAAQVGHGFVRNRRGEYATVDHPDVVAGMPGSVVNFAGTFVYGLNDRGMVAGGYTRAVDDARGSQRNALRAPQRSTMLQGLRWPE